VIIDGGNSYYRDDIRRAARLSAANIHYVGCVTSGGIWGFERGYCLMIGGDDTVVERLDPIWRTVAPGKGTAAPAPGRNRPDGTAEQGYLYRGPSGAGHFVKMVHNGVEYGMTAAIAEGLSIIERAEVGRREQSIDAESTPLRDPGFYPYDIDVADVAEAWRRRSVIGSWRVELTGDSACCIARSRPLPRPSFGLRRRTLDSDRGHRGGGTGRGDLDRAQRTLPIPQSGRYADKLL
jgi:6-phosphogluconate dehydrogenase